jgi:hypothetical protein
MSTGNEETDDNEGSDGQGPAAGDPGQEPVDLRGARGAQLGNRNIQINIVQDRVSTHPDPEEADRADEAFAARYRAFVVRAFDQFEFFGVDPGGVPRRHGFERGYYAPTLVPHEPANGGPASSGERADRALGPHRRVVVRGVAGAGKSTLLRWLGWQAAKAAPADEPPPIPFLVELGRYVGATVPDLEQLVPEPLRRGIPANWVSRMLTAGRVLLLLDGLDEMPPRDRAKVEDWLQEHLYLSEKIRCMVSTRPSVVAEQRWVDEGFRRFDLLPMSRYNIERYVRGWHGVAREDYPADTEPDREARQWLTECEDNLLKTLDNRPALGGMSANPLLCGLLCALHRDGEHLPENRKDVYDAALDLLMRRWPILRQRRRNIDDGDIDRLGEQETDVATGVRLNSQELQKLLQRLAFWMVANHELVLGRETAPKRARSSMAGLREDDPHRVLQYLAQECGLLRELPDRSLQFLHRTFRDHLAAKEVVEEENINLMLERADRPHWHDVVVMAGAHARPGERAAMLRTLVERADGEPANRETFVLLASAILEQAPVLPARQAEVRALVDTAVRGLIPPRSPDAADKLADVGPLVLDLLPELDTLTDDEKVLVVRTLAGIAAGDNPANAVARIQWLMEHSPRSRVKRMLEQLLMVWGRRGGYESYAQNVLREISLSDYQVSLQNPRRSKHIDHLKTITNLILREDSGSLAPVAALPSLRRLRLVRNTRVDLRPLGGARSLRVLELSACSAMVEARPIDVSPIRRMSLRRLKISDFPTKVDLSGLAGVRLHSLHLSGGALQDDITLPAGLEVRLLTLLARGRSRVDFTQVRGVRSLIIDRTPDKDELAALPELQRLIVVTR